MDRIETWDELFLRMAMLIAKKSKDPSTQTGCVVADPDRRVRSIGFNGFPAGVQDLPSRYANREFKYPLIAHCDSNAIYSAARSGISLLGCTMYLTGPPCSECMKGIIQSGIVEVVWPRPNKFQDDPETLARWRESFKMTELMQAESGVRFREVELKEQA